MTSPKQVSANRANAQSSTGPKSAAGKAKVAGNGLSHGLNASPETFFQAFPDQAEAFRSLALQLRKDCQPDSRMEEEAFQRYAWSTFQASRARGAELLTEDRWLANPEDPSAFTQMERTIKLAAIQERRADRALKELRALQRDRFAAYEVHAEHCVMGKRVDIPKSLPTADIRRTDLQRTNPNYLAQFLLYQTKEVKDKAAEMLDEAESKANSPLPKNTRSKANSTSAASEVISSSNPFANLSLDELLSLAKQTGLSK